MHVLSCQNKWTQWEGEKNDIQQNELEMCDGLKSPPIKPEDFKSQRSNSGLDLCDLPLESRVINREPSHAWALALPRITFMLFAGYVAVRLRESGLGVVHKIVVGCKFVEQKQPIHFTDGIQWTNCTPVFRLMMWLGASENKFGKTLLMTVCSQCHWKIGSRLQSVEHWQKNKTRNRMTFDLRYFNSMEILFIFGIDIEW